MNNNNSLYRTKILVFSHDASLKGGATISLLAVLTGLKEDFNFLVLLPGEGDLTDQLASAGISTRIVRMPWNASSSNGSKAKRRLTLGKFRFYRGVVKQIAAVVDEFEPDLIYTNTSVIYWGLAVSRLKQIKHVWHIREMVGQYGLVHEFGFRFFKWLLRQSDMCIFNSFAVMTRYGFSKSERRLVIYNGVARHSEFLSSDLANQHLIRKGLFVIVGAIERSKAQLTAIKVFAQWVKKHGFPYRLALYGGIYDPSYFEEIKAYIYQNRLEDIIKYNGFSNSIDSVLKTCDVLICSSTTEAFGRVLVEAMIKGVLVIARDVDGIPEIVNENNGYLYRSDDDLLNCLERVERDFYSLTALRQNALQTVLSKFTVEEYVNQMKLIFNRISHKG